MADELYRHAMRHILHTGQTHCYDVAGREIDCQGNDQDAEFLRGAPLAAAPL